MKIAFITEGIGEGKIPVDHPNMRTDLAWQYYLYSDHYSLKHIGTLCTKYDLAIIIIPKTNPGLVYSCIEYIKKYCNKVAIMQEGPTDFWTDHTLQDQIEYLTSLSIADFLLCHNTCDIPYFEGLADKPTYVMAPVMVHENFEGYMELTKGINIAPPKSIIIGGNMCRWYNGMVSLMIARECNSVVFAPSMGRKIPGEDKIDMLFHLGYMDWINWMSNLRRFQFAVHMMPTVAAGTFSLNCAYWGIPCIGNELVDTQRNCHPITSIPVNDIKEGMTLAKFFKKMDDQSYDSISKQIKINYNTYYHPDVFKKSMDIIFDKEL